MLARGNGSVLLEGQALGRKGVTATCRRRSCATPRPGHSIPPMERAASPTSVATCRRPACCPSRAAGRSCPGCSTRRPRTGRSRSQATSRSGALSARGRVTVRRSLTLGFGGGSAGRRDSRRNLLQNSFGGGQLVPRPDGTFLVPGGVGLSRPDGSGEEVSISRFAAAVLTSSLRLDRSFGGPARRLRVSVRAPTSGRGRGRAERSDLDRAEAVVGRAGAGADRPSRARHRTRSGRGARYEQPGVADQAHAVRAAVPPRAPAREAVDRGHRARSAHQPSQRARGGPLG